jgi:hypothetical protein
MGSRLQGVDCLDNAGAKDSRNTRFDQGLQSLHSGPALGSAVRYWRTSSSYSLAMICWHASNSICAQWRREPEPPFLGS